MTCRSWAERSWRVVAWVCMAHIAAPQLHSLHSSIRMAQQRTETTTREDAPLGIRVIRFAGGIACPPRVRGIVLGVEHPSFQPLLKSRYLLVRPAAKDGPNLCSAPRWPRRTQDAVTDTKMRAIRYLYSSYKTCSFPRKPDLSMRICPSAIPAASTTRSQTTQAL